MKSDLMASRDQYQRQNVQERKADRNASRALQLEQAMYNSRSRHLILVLTLSYKPEWQNAVTLDLIREHRNRLFNNRRCNELLQGICGYVWKIEEGQSSGGLHLHVVIFYSGHHRADIIITKGIGEYWANIVTEGMGCYWNSNAQKEMHVQHGHGIGTGQINRNDHIRRDALRQNLLYLAKNEQHIEARTNPHCHTFGTSQFP